MRYHLTLVRMAKIIQVRNRQMLARMWWKASTATLENSMEVPQNIQNRATLQPSNCTTGIYPKDTNAVIWGGTCTPMFIATMSTIAKLWKEPRCPSTDEWIRKMWSIYAMEYYSVIRKDEYPPFASTWMELEGIMLGEVSHAVKDNYHLVSLICWT